MLEQYILAHFDEAIENGYIKAYFQPLIRTLTGQVCCAETLARWEDPDMGFLSPVDFVPVLETHNLITRLDMTILRQACAFLQSMKEGNIHSLSVNFSWLDFSSPDFFDTVVGILAEYELSPTAINIEITESIIRDNDEQSRSVLDVFHKAGFNIWIDDFGSGYSSLNSIQNYKFDLIKIDMLFLRDFTQDSRKLISAIVSVAKSFGFTTLMEGVETEEQYHFLKDIGCEILQGFYFSKPLCSADFNAYLSENQAEPYEEKDYWNKAGQFDLISPHPFENSDTASYSTIPLALMEVTWGQANYLFANDAYIQNLLSLGFESIQELEHYFNDKISKRYNPMKDMLTKAVLKDSLQEIDYVFGDVFYSFKAKCVAKSRSLNKAVVAASLSIFKKGNEPQKRSDLLQYIQSVYSSFEHLNLLFPDTDSSIRMFSKANFQTAHQLKGLRQGIHSFCESEVHPDDRDRYYRFFDVDTLAARTAGNHVLHQGFRINDTGGAYVWRDIRINKVPSVLDNLYLYSIQDMSDSNIRIWEMLLKDHPEMLE